jgi:pyocin large subunit-like protein
LNKIYIICEGGDYALSAITKNTEEKQPITDEEVASLLKDNSNISAIGANKFKFGFSFENLEIHWEKHCMDYPGYTKEQYAEEALKLIQLPVNASILGYKNNKGQVIRYDINSKNFAKGHPDIGIVTMYKPDDGIDYYYDRKNKEEKL